MIVKEISENLSHFSKALLKWHAETPRPMPWKDTQNPYFIWLSEVILQQTRVAQGLPYYLKFIENYPTVHDLAGATEQQVLKDWQGLGYYSRARNLHTAAKQIVMDFGGQFPDNYTDILSLKGVGPYSAAAIGSFAFGLEYPVVDGNVKRVLSRYLDIEDSIDEPKVHKQIEAYAREAMQGHKSAKFNQAIMNFGALQCGISQPDCAICPVQKYCSSFANDTVTSRPVRSPKRKRTNRYFHYLVIESKDGFYLHQRTEKDIWQNMYTFPSIETKHGQRLAVKLRDEALSQLLSQFSISKKHTPSVSTRILTHRKVKGTFYRYEMADVKIDPKSNIHLVNRENLSNFALPKMIADYIDQYFV